MQAGMAAAKSGRQIAFRMGGNLGATAKKMRELGSAAYGLNASTETVQAGYQALIEKFSEAEIAAMGFSKAQDLVRMTEMVGDFKGYVGVLDDLADTWGFNAVGAKELVDDIYRIGGAFGQGEGAIAQMQANVESIGEAFNLLPGQIEPEKVRKGVESITALAGALSKSGFSAEDAWTKSRDLFKFLNAPKANLSKLMAGLDPGGDIFESLVRLSPALGSVDQAMAMLEKSPLEFVRAMNEVYKATDENSQQAKYLRGVFDSLGMRWALGNENLDGYIAGIVDANGEIKKMGPGLQEAANKMYSLNLTMDEQIDRAKDLFETRLIRIAGKEIRAFVSRSKGAYTSLGNVIGDLAADKGPLGLIVTKLVAVRKIGLSALLPTIGAFGDIIIDTVTNMAPLLTAMSSMGFKLSDLFVPLTGINKLMLGIPGALLGTVGPFAAVAGAVALLGRVLKKGEDPLSAFGATFEALPESMMRTLNWLGGDKWDKKMWESFRSLSSEEQLAEVEKSGKKLAESLWTDFETSFFVGVDLLKGWVVDAGATLWESRGAVSEALGGAWDWAVESAWPVVRAGVWTLWDHAKIAVGEVDWKGMGAAVSEALGKAWELAKFDAFPWVKRKLQWLWTEAMGFAEDIDFAGKAKNVWRYVLMGFREVVGKAPQLGKVFLSAIGGGWDWVVENKGMLAAKFVSGATVVVGGVADAMGKAFDALGSGAASGSGWVLTIVDFFGDVVERAVDALSDTNVAAIAAKFGGFLEGVFDAGFAGMTGYKVKEDVVLSPMERAIKNLGSGVQKIAGALYDVLAKVVGDMWDYAGTKFREWWEDPMRSMFEKVGDAFPRVMKAAGIALLFSSAFRNAIFGGLGMLLKGGLFLRLQSTIRGIGAGVAPAVAAAAMPAVAPAMVGGGAYLPGMAPPVPAAVPQTPWYRSPTAAARAGVGAAGAYVGGSRAGRAVGGWGSQVAGRAGPAMSWGMTGMLAGQVMQGMAKPGEGMDIAGGFVSDMAGGAAMGAMLGGPWGALIGGAAGAGKALYQLGDKLDERRKREEQELNKIEGSRVFSNLIGDLEYFSKTFARSSETFDQTMERIDKIGSNFAQANAVTMANIDGLNNRYQIQLSGIDSVIAGLGRYVDGKGVLSATQINATTSAMEALRGAGFLTEKEFAKFSETGSLAGLSDKIGLISEALEVERAIITDADRLYAMKLQTENLIYQGKVFEAERKERELRRKADKEVEKKGKAEKTAVSLGKVQDVLSDVDVKGAVAGLRRQDSPELIRQAKEYLDAKKYRPDDIDLRKFSDLRYAGKGGDLEATAKRILAKEKDARTEVEAYKATLASQFGGLKGLLGPEVDSLLDQIASGATDKMGQLEETIYKKQAEATAMLKSAEEGVAAVEALIDGVYAGLEEAGFALEEKVKQADDARTQQIAEGQAAHKKTLEAQAAAQKAEEEKKVKVDAYNKEYGTSLARFIDYDTKVGLEQSKDLKMREKWNRAQEIAGLIQRVSAFGLANRDLMNSPESYARFLERVGALGKQYYEGEQKFGAMYEGFGMALGATGVGMAGKKFPEYSKGGVSDMPSTGGLAMLHGRELVYPLDSLPSPQAIAGLREAIGQAGNRPSIQAAPPVKSAREAIQVVVDNDEANRELIQVLRDELGAVRKLLSVDKRYVLIDSRGSKVGAVQERSRSAAMVG